MIGIIVYVDITKLVDFSALSEGDMIEREHVLFKFPIYDSSRKVDLFMIELIRLLWLFPTLIVNKFLQIKIRLIFGVAISYFFSSLLLLFSLSGSLRLSTFDFFLLFFSYPFWEFEFSLQFTVYNLQYSYVFSHFPLPITIFNFV